jgi:hypothetical protein
LPKKRPISGTTIFCFAEGFSAAFDEDMLDSAFDEVAEDGGEGLASLLSDNPE